MRDAALRYANVDPALLQELAGLGSIHLRRAGGRKFQRLYNHGATAGVLANLTATPVEICTFSILDCRGKFSYRRTH